MIRHKKIPKVYVEPSAIGGVLDEGKSKKFDGCNAFLDLVRQGECILIISSVTRRELRRAPQAVRDVLNSLPRTAVIYRDINNKIKELANAYISAGILTKDQKNDAQHVAAATIYRAKFIVSCNFDDIVKTSKMIQFNIINYLNRYKMIEILCPKEVVEDE